MMKAVIFAAVILISAGFMYWDQVREPSTIQNADIVDSQSQDDLVPNVTLSYISGESVQLHDYKGKTVLLHFWATWCLPCIKEFPMLYELSQKYKDDIVLIAVSVDKDKLAIDRFLNRLNLSGIAEGSYPSFVIAHDPKQEIAQDAFQSVKYPETFMITSELIVDRKIVGEIDWLSDEMTAYISNLTKL